MGNVGLTSPESQLSLNQKLRPDRYEEDWDTGKRYKSICTQIRLKAIDARVAGGLAAVSLLSSRPGPVLLLRAPVTLCVVRGGRADTVVCDPLDICACRVCLEFLRLTCANRENSTQLLNSNYCSVSKSKRGETLYGKRNVLFGNYGVLPGGGTVNLG